METDFYHQIALSYFRGEIKPSEERTLSEWISLSEENRQLFAAWQSEWHRQAQTQVSPKTAKAWAKMQANLTKQQKKKNSNTNKKKFKTHRYIWYSVAAMALLVFGVALWLLQPTTKDPTWASIEKLPEAFKDTPLIFCTEAKREDITTHKGQMQTVALPDGSVVMMSEETTLAYDFGQTQRLVDFTGKAEFEVAKDTAHPFIVRVGEFSVTVVGTHFTLFAQPGNIFYSISLQEGAVKLGYLNDTITMLPGETVHFYPKKEKFMYDITGELGPILHQLEPVYKVKFILLNPNLEEEPVYYATEVGTTIEEITRALQSLLPIEFKQEDTTYYVSYR